MGKILELKTVKKSYNLNGSEFVALNETNLVFETGKFYAIVGHSGSGKSTLLQIIGLIKSKTSGTYNIYDKNVDEMNNDEKALFRNKYIGYMFQNFCLDEDINALENVMLPYYISNKKDYNLKKVEVKNMFKELGIENKEKQKPKKLSSGEQARVSIMRALVNNPSIILADEPTGNLDQDNEKLVFNLLKEETKKGKCVIVVSHSNEVKYYCDVLITIESGCVNYE